MASSFVKNLLQVISKPLWQLNRNSMLHSPSVSSVVYRCLSTAVTMKPNIWPGPYEVVRPAAVTFLGPNQLQSVQQSVGMKTKTALKKRCKDCFFVRRRGHMFVYCKTHPRHKQRQG
ncbi:39S ribosomal protein L36, mitochondrial [Callorhinchus milii]|uniref:Ribosomal protein n=1 Tax=Callorhinchus milii TaxID=7868 RepID=K4GLJ2_CALMI|nr:large ribosomal subunit protein bL36m [Callorhinchus milii]AFK10984.1 mitochondrial ribosomal protein L36-like protein [Callorhinchus milii]AFM90702.1 mitochondrial ribosomal protein L36-like protein [Callorhinchus milii]|eukprot:gi/632937814/ref/XP_007901218.1/ PREDICTED: 39S ribosomal protein L36, mitochondrial [Callorhinchus milii]